MIFLTSFEIGIYLTGIIIAIPIVILVIRTFINLKISLPYFILYVIFRILFVILNFTIRIENHNFIILRIFSVLATICLYKFLERMDKLKTSTLNISILFSLSTIRLMVILLNVTIEYSDSLSFLRKTRWTMTFLTNLFVYGYGLKIFWKSYKLTNEKNALLLIIPCIISCSSAIITFIIYSHFWEIPDNVYIVITYFEWIFGLMSHFFILLFFIFRSTYFFRFPHENYMLMVLLPSGNPIFKVEFHSKNQIVVADEMISAFLSAINGMFKETLHTNNIIESITNDEATILINQGKYIITTLVGTKANKLLLNAIKVFTKLFEEKFHELLSNNISNKSKYNDAEQLIPTIFPFIKIKTN